MSIDRIKAITGTKPSRWWRVRAKGTSDATAAEGLEAPVEEPEAAAAAAEVKCRDRIANKPETATKMSAAHLARRRRKTRPIQR